jgi:hypothetical protein
MNLLAFIATWTVLGVVVAWLTHSESIIGERDDQ